VALQFFTTEARTNEHQYEHYNYNWPRQSKLTSDSGFQPSGVFLQAVNSPIQVLTVSNVAWLRWPDKIAVRNLVPLGILVCKIITLDNNKSRNHVDSEIWSVAKTPRRKLQKIRTINQSPYENDPGCGQSRNLYHSMQCAVCIFNCPSAIVFRFRIVTQNATTIRLIESFYLFFFRETPPHPVWSVSRTFNGLTYATGHVSGTSRAGFSTSTGRPRGPSRTLRSWNHGSVETNMWP
jgi:hypothetical protein